MSKNFVQSRGCTAFLRSGKPRVRKNFVEASLPMKIINIYPTKITRYKVRIEGKPQCTQALQLLFLQQFLAYFVNHKKHKINEAIIDHNFRGRTQSKQTFVDVARYIPIQLYSQLTNLYKQLANFQVHVQPSLLQAKCYQPQISTWAVQHLQHCMPTFIFSPFYPHETSRYRLSFFLTLATSISFFIPPINTVIERLQY